MSEVQIKSRLQDLHFSLTQLRDDLQTEQDISENEYADWENRESSDSDGVEEGESEVIDNQAQIDRYDEALNHVDAAIKALANE